MLKIAGMKLAVYYELLCGALRIHITCDACKATDDFWLFERVDSENLGGVMEALSWCLDNFNHQPLSCRICLAKIAITDWGKAELKSWLRSIITEGWVAEELNRLRALGFKPNSLHSSAENLLRKLFPGARIDQEGEYLEASNKRVRARSGKDPVIWEICLEIRPQERRKGAIAINSRILKNDLGFWVGLGACGSELVDLRQQLRALRVQIQAIVDALQEDLS